MKQLGLAVLNYESAKKELPPAYTVKPKHNYVAFILPYIEQGPLAGQYNLKKDWNDAGNRTPGEVTNVKLAATGIDAVRCPTTPNVTTRPPSGADYAICVKFNNGANTARPKLIAANQIKNRGAGDLPWASMLYVEFDADDDYIPVELKDITDGLSNSFMLFEDAGRPEGFDQAKNPTNQQTVSGTGWADFQSFFDVHDECGGGQMMNCHNNNEIFSFHVGGCMFTMGDGSVRLVREDIGPEAFTSLFTRAAEDQLGESG